MIGTIRQRVAASLLALSAIGVGAIVKHEGMLNVAYVDPVGVVTVCAGHTKTAKLGQRLSDARCEELLRADVRDAEAAIKRHVRVPLTQEQYDALVSFVFNVGGTAFANSTMLRQINSGQCMAAGAQFSRWVFAKGRKLPGLVTRRADERKLWESGCALS